MKAFPAAVILVAMATVALVSVSQCAKADELSPAPAIAAAPAPAKHVYVPQPGDVVEVSKDGDVTVFTKIDINKFFVLGVEWLPVSQLSPGVEVGLRQDGVVIWRRK